MLDFFKVVGIAFLALSYLWGLKMRHEVYVGMLRDKRNEALKQSKRILFILSWIYFLFSPFLVTLIFLATVRLHNHRKKKTPYN